MAGDIDRRERCIVLPRTPHPAGDAAGNAVRTAGTETIHQYGQRVLVADVPLERDERVEHEVALASAPALYLAESDPSPEDGAAADLEDDEALGLAAFELRTSAEYEQAKATRAHGDEPWSQADADVLPPDAPAAALAEADEDLGELAAAATSARLTGSVAVGIIIVEGPTNALKFSQAERVKVVAEVQNGLGWLGAQSSPQGVRWVYDVRVVTLATKPAASDTTLAQKEARFRDPALAAMGHGPGLAGTQAYVDALRTSRGTDWAYCAFFTKYPVGHFAYASLGGPRLVMHYDNDGWGPDNIDRVFAHETGHIFNAPDEYAGSGCDCGGQWGHFKIANGNCENCASGGGVACIMKSNSWEVCSYTPYHLGFPQGARYTGVFAAGTGGHGFWVNASWAPFVSKWQEWSSQGLRLVDLDIAQIGSQYRYSGAFRAGSGPYALWAMADWSSFLAKWQQWSGQGMRLVDIEVTRVGAQTRYSGVYVRGSGGYGLWALADWNSFVAKWQQWSSQGLRLVDLGVTLVNGAPRYSGVFQQGSGSYALWALADWPSFRAKWQQWSSQGLRLVDIERTRVGSQTRYSGVFQHGTGGHALWTGASWTSFRAKWQEWSSQGLRLVDLSMDPTGIETLASMEAGAETAAAASGLEGLLGFGGAPLTLEAADGPEAPGQGELSLEADAADAAGLGTGAVSLGLGAATTAAPGHVGNGHVDDMVGAATDGGADGSPPASGMGGSSLAGAHEGTSEPSDASTAGAGDAVIDAPADPNVPPLAGIGMIKEG